MLLSIVDTWYLKRRAQDGFVMSIYGTIFSGFGVLLDWIFLTYTAGPQMMLMHNNNNNSIIWAQQQQ
jgi:hypothetical protein